MSVNGCVVDGWKKEWKTIEEETENFTAWDIFNLDWSYKFIVLLGKDIQKYSDCIFECGHVPAYDQLGGILFCSVE